MSVGRITRYGLPFSNVVATGTATSEITVGRTLETYRAKLGGTALTKAMVSLFRIKSGSKTLVEAKGADLDKINAYRNLIAADPAYLDVFFSDYSMNNELDRHVGAFDTSLISTKITTEVQIAGATAPTVTPILIESASQKSPTGEMQPYAPLIGKLLPYPFAIPNGGRLPVSVPFGPVSGSIIKRLHVFHNGNMTGATVKQDGMVFHESVRLENEYDQKRYGRNPQANVYTIDFVVDGDVRKALDTRDAKSLEWLFDFSAADNGTIYVEYLDPLGNL